MRAARLILAATLLFPVPLLAQGMDLTSAAYGALSTVALPTEDPHSGESAFRILDINSGGFAEGLAASGTALAGDSSSIPWNPAASSFLDYTELAISHNSWISDSKIEGATYAIRLGHLGLGVAGRWLYSGLTEYDDFGVTVSNGTYSEALVAANLSYDFLSGFYWDGISLGANLKLAYRGVPDHGDETGTLVPGSGADQSAVAVMGDLGLITRFNFLKLFPSRTKNAAFGISIRNLGPSFDGDPLPTAVSIGAAYAPLRPLFVTASYTQPIDLYDIQDSEWPSFAAGATCALVENLISVHGGIQIGSSPRITAGAVVNLASVSLAATYTLDFLTQFKDGNRISVEARFNLGDQGRYAVKLKVEDLYLRGLNAYALKKVDEAISFWKEALKLDPGFDPARIHIESAQKALKFQEDLQSLRFFDESAPQGGSDQGTGTQAPSDQAKGSGGSAGSSGSEEKTGGQPSP